MKKEEKEKENKRKKGSKPNNMLITSYTKDKFTWTLFKVVHTLYH